MFTLWTNVNEDVAASLVLSSSGHPFVTTEGVVETMPGVIELPHVEILVDRPSALVRAR
jgi:hypothetical protein